MSTPSLFVITVSVTAEGARSSLLAMASVLHRRGVEVVEAGLGRASTGRRVFNATFVADPMRAATVLRSFESLVDVVDACLFEAFDARSTSDISIPASPRPSSDFRCGPQSARSQQSFSLSAEEHS